ncbi:unnamed protein product [Pedinophyceae sp. YPF-701]|nr:unnamed protein product [Pedinophyceae sp. YPF-701]
MCRAAARQGADFIECDVVVTADLTLICRHEPVLDFTSNAADVPHIAARARDAEIDGERVHGVLASDLTSEDIRALRARQRFAFRPLRWDDQFRVATFAEYLEVARNATRELGRPVGVAPELKHPAWHNALPALQDAGATIEGLFLDALRKGGFGEHAYGTEGWRRRPALVQCTEPESLRRLKAMSQVPGVQLADRGNASAKMLTDAGLRDVAKYAIVLSPDKTLLVESDGGGRGADDLGHEHVTGISDLTQRAHAAGLLVVPWTFRNEREFTPITWQHDPWMELAMFYEVLGVDGAFTDFPGTHTRFVDRTWGEALGPRAQRMPSNRLAAWLPWADAGAAHDPT